MCTINGVLVACPDFFAFAFPIFIFVGLVVGVLTPAALFWGIFVKAGKPGWATMIPVYNAIVFLQIIHKPTWWIVLFFIPFVNTVFGIICLIELAKVFGKGTGFIFGLIFLSYVFLPILSYGSAQYSGDKLAA